MLGSEARAIAPLVTVVNSTNTRQSDYFGRASRPGPGIAWFRGILVQRKVAAIDVVVRNVAVGTEKKSIPASTSRWFCRNLFHRSTASGPAGFLGM